MNSPTSTEDPTTQTNPTHTPKPLPINLWHPHINDTPITSHTQLHTLIHTKYPALTRHPRYPKLLADAERHLTLLHTLKDQTHLHRGDSTQLARQFNLTRGSICRIIRQALRPRLYWFLDNAISKTQARKQLAQIHHTNTHLHSLHDLHTRLGTYYPTQYLELAPKHHHRLNQCQKYFTALTHLAEGGHSYSTIANLVGKTVNNTKEWITNKTRPGYLNLARRIPPIPPPSDHQWLPLIMQGRYYPRNFITIPTSIHTWHDIPPVLHQLTPLTNDDMSTWHQNFGPITQEEAFAYLLGALVSDAGKITPHYTSTRLELILSKNYDWSQHFGDAVCYYLGHLGIKAEAKQPTPDKHRWRSQNSPLLTWIKHTCLGLHPTQLTTYTHITATYLLTAPKPIRTKFLQGLNDGDGFVLVGYQQLGNASEVNSPFLTELLDTFGISSYINVRRVIIRRNESIIHAVELPFFLHATGRQQQANKLAVMIATKKLQDRGIHWKAELCIHMLAQQGKSAGEIVEFIYDHLNLCYSDITVRKIIKEGSGI